MVGRRNGKKRGPIPKERELPEPLFFKLVTPEIDRKKIKKRFIDTL